jgi:hypothetical protein
LDGYISTWTKLKVGWALPTLQFYFIINLTFDLISGRVYDCDYAWLMIEALRRLGLACRFVSGYLYDAALDGGEVGMTGSGATHAWLQVYLPGAGWRNYDPTNQIFF